MTPVMNPIPLHVALLGHVEACANAYTPPPVVKTIKERGVKVRNLQPGQWFVLLRTGEAYQFIRRDHGTPYGTRYVVKHSLFGAGESTLHHSCHVDLVKERTISHESAR